jgi:CheY-like chemotaxis protein
MMMPGMTGLALAEAIGIDYPHVRVILTSGYAPPALLNRYNRPYPYVAKPYRIEQVLVLLE